MFTLSLEGFRPRTHPTCSDLNSSVSVRRCLPTRLPTALSAKGHWTLATIPRSPLAAILDAASSISPVFATLTKNTGGGVYSSFSANPLHSPCPNPLGVLKSTRAQSPTDPFDVRHRPIAAFPFRTLRLPAVLVRRIRTSAKRARIPFRIRTSKTQHLNSFRIRTYEKTGVGGRS